MGQMLMVAAGGGGDVIGAAMLHASFDRHGARPAIATFAWDRLAIDPVPGPRGAADFRGLRPVGRHNYQVHATTRPVPPAGSTLPRLARELSVDLYLLDPTSGVAGLSSQLVELVTLLHATDVCIVDVGGDVVAVGDESSLRSPLADALVLAAVAWLHETRVVVAGPGLDGELLEQEVVERCRVLGCPDPYLRLDSPTAARFRGIFAWHPSEASGLLRAAALGWRGSAEIRDAGLRVSLTDASPSAWVLEAPVVLGANLIAQELLDTQSLEDVEAALRRTGRESEIDYERRKATASRSPSARQDPTATAVLSLAQQARDRDIDILTLRRLREGLDLQTDQLAQLQQLLTETWNEAFEPPVLDLRRLPHLPKP